MKAITVEGMLCPAKAALDLTAKSSSRGDTSSRLMSPLGWEAGTLDPIQWNC